MKKKHPCLLCMGSNTDRRAHLSAAREALRILFPGISFGSEMETEAVGTGFFSPFSNQMAKFATWLSMEEIHAAFKALEKQAGRLPEHKSQGVVYLDVDLLSYDHVILKPEDWERDYVQRGVAELRDTSCR